MRRESDISAVHTFYSTLLGMNIFSLQLFQLPGIVSYFLSNFEILLIDNVTLSLCSPRAGGCGAGGAGGRVSQRGTLLS